MARIKVRFNLGRGVNYMKWKIQYPNGIIEYYSATDVQLVMKGCQLRNYQKTAEKIFNGANKTVCAWILCDEIEIRKTNFAQWDLICDRIKYNPRVQPNWTLNGIIVDNQNIEVIGSVDYGLYKIR
jgi:hypothetical protein